MPADDSEAPSSHNYSPPHNDNSHSRSHSPPTQTVNPTVDDQSLITEKQRELLRVSQLYGSGVGGVKAKFKGDPGRNKSIVSDGSAHFPFGEHDLFHAKQKVLECREIHHGGGVRVLEQAVTSACFTAHWTADEATNAKAHAAAEFKALDAAHDSALEPSNLSAHELCAQGQNRLFVLRGPGRSRARSRLVLVAQVLLGADCAFPARF